MKRTEFTVETAVQRLRLLQVDELNQSGLFDGRGASEGDEEEKGSADVKDMTKLEHTLMLRSAIDFSKGNMVSVAL